MIRDLKLLVLSLVAIAVPSVTGASAASAQQAFLTSDGPVTLIGVETGETSTNLLTAFGEKIECPGSFYTGHKYNVTPHSVIPSGATTVTITPHHIAEKCRSSNNLFMTWTMNGCDYVFHFGETSPAGNEEGTYGLTADIACPEGKAIEWHLYTSSSELTKVCTVKINSQTGLKGLHVTSTSASEDLDISGAMEGIHMERSGAFCSSLTTKEAKFDIDITVKGTNEIGAETGIAVSE